MDALCADTRSRKSAGLAVENDVVSASVQSDRMRLRREEAARQEQLNRAELAMLIGQELPPDSTPRKPAPGNGAAPPEQESLNAALANRAELAGMASGVRAAREQVKAEESGKYPQCYLNVRYETARPNSFSIPPEDRWRDDAFAGVVVSWNLFDWGSTRAKVARADARAEQAKLQEDQLKDEVMLEVRRASINLENARRRAEVAAGYEKSAELNVKTATDLWNNRLALQSEVLDAQSRLADAQYETVCALADLTLAGLELAFARGELDKAAKNAPTPQQPK
jgi:outer membrane protein TolC